MRRPLVAALLALAVLVPAGGAAQTVAEPVERVVSIDWGLAETLIALGVPPLGLAESGGYREWVSQPALPDSVAEIGLRSTPNLEFIAALEPDLIVTTPQFAAIEPVLAGVAPVLSLATYTETLTPYRNAVEITRRLGDLLDREDAAARLIDETDARIEALAEALEGAGTKRVLVLNFHDERNAWVFAEGSLYHDVLTRAGLENAWQGGGNAWGIVNATVDQFAGFDDVAVLIVGPVPLSIRARLESDEPDGLLGQLPVFQTGNYRILPSIWGFGALPAADRFAEALLGHEEFLRAGDAS